MHIVFLGYEMSNTDFWETFMCLALTVIFLKLVQCQPQLNHQTQPFWVKGVWLVPNSQTLADFGIGVLRFVTVGVFWLGPLKRILCTKNYFLQIETWYWPLLDPLLVSTGLQRYKVVVPYHP